jgi:anti-sigma B factor antagonist
MNQLALEGDLTIFNANEQMVNLLNFIRSGNDLEINLSQVEEVDTAGLQLLILIKRLASQEGKILRFVLHSKGLLDILEMTNLTSVFGDQVVLVQNEVSRI